MQLTGKNFQPWADFTLDVNKLTVIIGPSNKGKSALFRSLKGILRNELPPSFIREKHDLLELKLAVDGHTVKSTRARKGSVHYILDEGTPDEKTYSSLGGKLPDAVTAMKFGVIRLGDTTIDPIFAPQNKAQFLIDHDAYKDSDINAILGAFSSTEKLDKGKKEANLRVSQKNSEARTLAEEAREAEERKAKLADLVPKGVALTEKIAKLESQIQTEEKRAAWAALSVQYTERVLPLREIAHTLTLPDLTEADALQQKVGLTATASTTLTTTRRLRKLGAVLEEAVQSDLSGISKVQKTVEDVAEAEHWLIEVRRSTKLSVALKESADIWAEVVATYKQSRAVADLQELLTHNNDTLTTLKTGMDKVIDSYQLKNVVIERCVTSIRLLGELPALQSRVGGLEERLSKVDEELAAKTAEMIELHGQTICPKCGKVKEHVCNG